MSTIKAYIKLYNDALKCTVINNDEQVIAVVIESRKVLLSTFDIKFQFDLA